MKKIVIIIFSSMFGLYVLAETAINEAEFTKKYVSVVKKKAAGIKAEIKSSLEIEFTTSNGEKATTYLNNAYNEYLSSPNDIDDIMERYSTALSVTNSTLNEDLGKERIFPVIKDIEYIRQITELMKRKEENGKFPFYYQKLNEVLYVLYAFDTPSSIRYMPKEDIEKLGVKEDSLLGLSKANLRKAIPSLQVQGDPSTFSMLIADGTYEASFLLFDDLWTKEQFPVQGDIVVYVPSRDLVLITGSKDSEGLEKVRSIVHNPETQWSHTVSEIGFIRSGNEWKVFNL
jgi:uncharacterized protein YtpQ (UPF0354 family)